MLDTTPILWLQERASPALTAVMQAVSFGGYAPSCLAAAIVCAFGWRLRLGLTLILAILAADAMTVVAKGAVESPRPHAADARVRALGAFTPGSSRLAAGTAVPADRFGFPSGHVATTAAWVLGLAWARRGSWTRGLAVTWVALMGLSRMYLGRHFPADVLGGLVVGIAGIGVARLVLPPAAGGGGRRRAGMGRVLGLSLLLAAAGATLFSAGLGAHDAGRVCGLAGAALLLAGTPAVHAAPRSARAARVGAALVLLGVALWSSTWTSPTGPAFAVIGTMAVSAALHAAVLLVPAHALGDHRRLERPAGA